MSKPSAPPLDDEDTIRCLVKARTRNRMLVMSALFFWFAAFVVATVLIYTNP